MIFPPCCLLFFKRVQWLTGLLIAQRGSIFFLHIEMQFTRIVNYAFIEVIIKEATRREGYLSKNASYKSLQTDIFKRLFIIDLSILPLLLRLLLNEHVLR